MDGTYWSVRLPVCGPPGTAKNRSSVVDFDRRGRLREKSIVGYRLREKSGRLREKKGRRRRKRKRRKKEEENKET
ncbi:hypothetical protein B296_00048766 [Ensete ventricosum]|uniref:Uncharacterized protein n=1 Tax=Ensete ventricosum TaxID=4639 RepID=A0A426YTF9_ENSVE|nr:hypothetical protein B296_00048766 [Ensete ventricosum]